jgi:putative transcription factor
LFVKGTCECWPVGSSDGAEFSKEPLHPEILLAQIASWIFQDIIMSPSKEEALRWTGCPLHGSFGLSDFSAELTRLAGSEDFVRSGWGSRETLFFQASCSLDLVTGNASVAKDLEVPMETQDWKEVVLNSRPRKDKSAEVNAALRSGDALAEKKHGAGSNKKNPLNNPKRLDEAHEPERLETVPLTLAKRIQQARQRKGWTQTQLAQAIGERARVVNDYERATVPPSPQIINKMEKALGVRLRGPTPTAAATNRTR